MNLRHGPDIVAIILAVAFSVCFFALLMFPIRVSEAGVLALKDIWLVIVGALAGYIARGVRGDDQKPPEDTTPPQGPGQDAR